MRNPTRKLRVVEATGLEHTVDAPPVLVASSHTIDFLCGNCGIVLMHAEDDQVHGLFIYCNKCGPATRPTTHTECVKPSWHLAELAEAKSVKRDDDDYYRLPQSDFARLPPARAARRQVPPGTSY
jgi:hypothetical protein